MCNYAVEIFHIVFFSPQALINVFHYNIMNNDYNVSLCVEYLNANIFSRVTMIIILLYYSYSSRVYGCSALYTTFFESIMSYYNNVDSNIMVDL